MEDLIRLKEALTSTYHSFIYRSPHDCPSTIIESLQQELSHLDIHSWNQRLELGGVFLNGKPVYGDTELSVPCMVEYFEPKYSLESLEQKFPPFDPSQIIFEDETILVVYKPAGLPCLPTREQRRFNLKAQLETYLAQSSSEASLHLPSRLDTSVSGLVVTSKNARFHSALQRAYEMRTAHKCYLMEVAGTPEWTTHICQKNIAKDPRHPILRKAVDREGKSAQTRFTVLSHGLHRDIDSGHDMPSAVLEAQPITGRTHQIRVHAESLGLPIIGDNFYGGPRTAQLRLMSSTVSFAHPASGAEMKISLPQRFWPDWLLSCPRLNF